jgi:hypothetical protein
MKNKLISYLSNGSLILGAGIAVYVLVDVYVLSSKLPPSVCPITNNKPLLYSAIALCGISVVFSFFESKNIKVKD